MNALAGDSGCDLGPWYLIAELDFDLNGPASNAQRFGFSSFATGD
jgi:hypothetical protein